MEEWGKCIIFAWLSWGIVTRCTIYRYVKTYWQLLRTKPLYFASESILDEEWAGSMKEEVSNKGIKVVFLEQASYMQSLLNYKKRAGLALKNLAKELQVAVVA